LNTYTKQQTNKQKSDQKLEKELEIRKDTEAKHKKEIKSLKIEIGLSSPSLSLSCFFFFLNSFLLKQILSRRLKDPMVLKISWRRRKPNSWKPAKEIFKCRKNLPN